jgi:hypothetical protein
VNTVNPPVKKIPSRDLTFELRSLYAAIFDDPLGKKRFLIPVRVAACEIPPIVRHLVYIDLVGKEESIARQLLLDGVLPARERPAKHVRRVFVGKLPAVDPALFGRGSELAQLVPTCINQST